MTRYGLGKPSQRWLMGLWCVAGDELPTPSLGGASLELCLHTDAVDRRHRSRGRRGGGILGGYGEGGALGLSGMPTRVGSGG